MHIGILYMGRKGGICQYTYELSRALSKKAKVTCYLSNQNTLLEEWRNEVCSTRTFDTYQSFSSLVWSMLSQRGAVSVARAIDGDAPDILLDTGSGPWQALIKKALRRKFVLADVIHDVQFHPDRWSTLLHVYKFLYPSRANIYVGLSDYSYKQLLVNFPHSNHIRSGIGVTCSPASIDIDKIVRNSNKLLFFGRVEKYKGIEVLVDAFKMAKKRNPQLSLSIIGYGPLSSRLKRDAAIPDVRVKNEWIEEKDIPSILSDHGIMVIPYLSATQSGVAAVAVANGLPSIATNTGALPEQIINGRNGLIVPPNDPHALASAILNISLDRSLACKMSEEACGMALTNYSWEHIADKLLMDLERLLA